jgi:chromosome segregation and condensation protein ScpB
LGLLKAKKEGHTNLLTLSDEFYDYFNVSSGEGNVLKGEVIKRDELDENIE